MAYLNQSVLEYTLGKLKTEFDGKVNNSEKGVANGVATLDGSGKIPSTQLPSYVDDVLEYDKVSDFPETGESGKIYISKEESKSYRWTGTTYAEIVSSGLVIGTTTGTAMDGGIGTSHINNKSNPHEVTKTQVGLANVTNDKQVKGLESGATSGHIVTWGVDGYTVADSGFTIAKSVPNDAVFTDTVTTATTTGDGNAVTAITATDGALSVVKGTTFLVADDIADKEDTSNKVTSWASTTAGLSDDKYPSEKLVKVSLDAKLDTSSAITEGDVDEIFGRVFS